MKYNHYFLLLFFVFTIVQCNTVAQEAPRQNQNWKETDYSDYIQTLIGGEREYHVESGYVDILTDDYAYEVEWANKWKNSIGQALWYALQTEHRPAIILVLKKKTDIKYAIQLTTTLKHAGLEDKVKVEVFPYDFQEKMGRHFPVPK